MARHELGHFDLVSEWFPRLTKEYTFDTRFLSLTIEQGEAIVKTREVGRMLGSMYSMADSEEEKAKIVENEPRDMIDKHHQEALKQILIELSKNLKQVFL